MIAQASNAFGFDLWRKLGDGNAAIAPASIAATLAMTYLGARGKTADQMRRVLHLDGADVAGGWGELARSLAIDKPGLTLRIANRLFGHTRYTFEPAFLETLASGFDAALEPLDFADTEPARRHINAWVAEHTDGHIASLLDPGVLSEATRLVLVNAVYFLGRWTDPFDPSRTKPAAFWVSPDHSKPVPTMHRTGAFATASVDGATVLELPYRGDTTAMYIVLPEAKDGLPALERRLDAKTFATWTTTTPVRSLAVSLPRFTIEAPPLRLDTMLKALGMPLAFDVTQADFTGMARPARKQDELVLDAVVHQARVEVDEAGTVATAATAAMMAPRGRPSRPLEFIADHPFLFVIADRRTKLALFVGRVVDPSE